MSTMNEQLNKPIYLLQLNLYSSVVTLFTGSVCNVMKQHF